jgi:hypothetical protein
MIGFGFGLFSLFIDLEDSLDFWLLPLGLFCLFKIFLFTVFLFYETHNGQTIRKFSLRIIGSNLSFVEFIKQFLAVEDGVGKDDTVFELPQYLLMITTDSMLAEIVLERPLRVLKWLSC